MNTIINFRLKRLVFMLCVLCIFSIYSGLLIWSTKSILHFMGKKDVQHQETIDKLKKSIEKGLRTDAVVEKPKNGKVYWLGNSSQTEFESNTGTCKKELSLPQKRWYKARYNEEIQPLWEEDNLELDYVVFDWWLSIQQSPGLDVQKLFQNLFNVGVPRKNPYKRKEAEKEVNCRKCAVVGNSGNLKTSNYGKKIDAHDFVLRMNNAPIIGYEKDVGSKTTHRFMYPESAVRNLPMGASFVLIPFKPMDVKWLLSALTTGDITKTYAPVPNRIVCDVSKVLILNPEFIRYVHDRWTQHHGSYPSTGLLAVIYALHECDQVELFGFGANENGNWHHYWEELPASVSGAFKATGVHDADWERTILNELHKQGIIKIYRPTE